MHIYKDLRDITEEKAPTGQLYIYVIENYPAMNIKIGRTTNPIQRFKSLSGSNNGGNIIKRVAVSPVTYLYTIEQNCHNHFYKNRINGTEYFKDISFDMAVNYINKIFNGENYNRSNQIRKEFYEKNPDMMPKFLIDKEI